jgi:NifU-like protein
MTLFVSFPWQRYSKKLAVRIDTPCSCGIFTKEEAEERSLLFASNAAGELEEGNCVRFYWLVDPADGVIIDARFQAFGNSALIGAAEVACELVIGKNYDQARRMSAELFLQHVYDKITGYSFPEEAFGFINMCLEAFDKSAEDCSGLPLRESYVAPPISMHDIEILEGGYPGWKELSLPQKLAVIEEVIAKEVRPYIEMDAGGIEVINLLRDHEVLIAYHGSCTTCHSATGATLSYIQQVLRARISQDLEVIPNI